MATSREMTAGPALPLIFNFTMPLLLGNLLQQTYSLVDAAIVGKFLGINALAAVGASSSVIFLILGFCNGCSCGFGIPVAQKFGARDYVMMRRYVAVSLQLSLVMSVMIALITSIYCADILRIMRTPENIFEGAYAYLLVTFIGVPCTFLYNLLSSIIRALGDSKTPFWFLLFSTILNIILDLFCILVLKWGVLGAAIATIIPIPGNHDHSCNFSENFQKTICPNPGSPFHQIQRAYRLMLNCIFINRSQLSRSKNFI